MSQEDVIELLEVVSVKSKASKQTESSTKSKQHTHPVEIVVHASPTRKSLRRQNTVFSDTTSFSTNLSDSAVTDNKHRSASETHSYRDKIRERFELVKKRASKSEKGLSGSILPKVSDLKTSLKAVLVENQNVNREINEYKSSKPEETVSQVEAYNFFCESIENELRDTQNQGVEPFMKSTEMLISKSMEGVCDLSVHYVKAEQLETLLILSAQNSFRRPTGTSDIVYDGDESYKKNLEEDGLYVPEQPKISAKVLTRLCETISDTDREKWLGADGSLLFLSSPHSEHSIRPSMITNKNREMCEYISASTTLHEECNEIIVDENKILELQIYTVKFTHHPLFSTEHILQQKLLALYNLYKTEKSNHDLTRISSRLNAVRDIKEQYKEKLKQSGDVLKDSERLIAYSKEIIKLRELLFQHGKEQRETLKAVLATWKALKKTRDNNGYSNTTIRLVIKKDKSDYLTEKEQFERDIELVCNEIISEGNEQYESEMQIYKSQLRKWKMKKDDDEETIEKPKKPIRIVNEEEIRSNVPKMFEESFKPPGEPLLHLELTYDNAITEHVEDVSEQQRRSAVKAMKLYLRILCTDMEVCKTKHCYFNDLFECVLDESVSIQLIHVPVTITIEIYEQSNTLFKRKYGEIILNVPKRNSFHQVNAVFQQYFQRDEIVHYKHAGVGSGITIKSVLPDLDFDENLITSGVVEYNLSWDFSLNKSLPNECSSSKPKEFDEVFTEDGDIDVNKLKSWVEKNDLDPENPKNAEIFQYISLLDGATSSQHEDKKYFRTNPTSFNFCSHDEIEQNVRFKMLQLRNKNVASLSGMVVPNRIKEIPVNILQNCAVENSTLMEPVDVDCQIDVQRAQGRNYLKQVLTRIFQQCRNTDNNLLYEDLVDEKSMANFEVLAQLMARKFLNFFKLRPTIGNLPILSSMKNGQNSAYKSELAAVIRIEVSLKTGINIPTRTSSKVPKSRADSTKLLNEEPKPFVEFRLGEKKITSQVANGSNPIWNQDVVLQLDTAHSDYLNPESLSGLLYVNVYDSITDSNDGEPVKNKYLGCIEVPVAAICSSHKLAGHFRVKTPQVILGYEIKSERRHSSASDTQRWSSPSGTYLYLTITATPPIPKLIAPTSDLPSNELPYMKDHILEWNESFNNSFPARRFSSLVIDTNGRTSCITRYIRPLEPPQLHSDGIDMLPDHCAQFVSMIPLTTCNKFYESVCLTTDQLLRLGIGSVLDHAIALTCYLLAINIEAWLLLGFGVPQGSTAYVLVREYVENAQIPLHYIYDATTGNKYKTDDVFCPLQKIFCVIDEHNIWANVQRTDNVSKTTFDFTRRFEWMSLFNNKVSAPTNTVQLKLSYMFAYEVQELETRIEKKIRKKFSKMRKLERTVWNHSVSSSYKNVLRKLEMSHLYGKQGYELGSEAKKALPDCYVQGVICNLPYTSVTTLAMAVLSFGIQNEPNGQTEFVLSVYINSYPSHVLSVWICIGCIKK